MLFEHQQFRGNTEQYYHPHNSYLSMVLRTRRGLPITMTLVYKAVVEQLGLPVDGIAAPGHFLAGVTLTAGEGGTASRLLIDPFDAGRELSRDEAYRRMEQTTGARVPRREDLLAPCTHRQWLIRMLNNLVAVFHAQGRAEDVAAMNELKALVERG